MFGIMPEELAKQFNGYPGSFVPYAKAVGTTMKEAFPDEKVKLIVEPGTAMVGNSMGVLSKVTSIKNVRGETFITVNCCSNQLGFICDVRDIPYEISNIGRSNPVEVKDVNLYDDDRTDSGDEGVDIPENVVIYRQTENNKTIAINPETGETSGLGPEIDHENQEQAERTLDTNGSSDNIESEGNNSSEIPTKEMSQSERAAVLKRALDSGVFPNRIDRRKQNRRREGTPEHNRYLGQGERKTILDLSDDEITEVLNNDVGTKSIHVLRDGSVRKYFMLDKVVGHDTDDNGGRVDYHCGCFVFSKKSGWHAFPCEEEFIKYDEARKDETKRWKESHNR